MREQWRVMFFLLVFTLLSISGVIIGRHSIPVHGTPLDATRLQRVVNDTRENLIAQLDNLPVEKITSHESLWRVIDSIGFDDQQFLVFQGSDLVGWSCRLLPVHGINPQYFKHAVVLLDNGWYLSAYRQHGAVMVVALELLKYEFPYQNQFLRDGFPENFGLDPSVMISREQNPGFIIINDSSGNFLFSLSPHGLKQTEPELGIIAALILAIAAIALWVALYLFQTHPRLANHGNYTWVVASLLHAGGLYLLGWHLSPVVTNSIELFSPLHFAMSDWLPSLGHFLIYAIILFTTSFWFYKFFKLPARVDNENYKVGLSTILLIILVALSGFALFYVNHLFNLLAQHSSGPLILTRMIDMNLVSLVKISIVGLLLVTFLMVFEKTISMLCHLLPRWRVFGTIVAVATVLALVPTPGGDVFNMWTPIFFIITGAILAFTRRTPLMTHKYSTFLWIAAFFAIYAGVIMMNLAIQKEESNRELLIDNLSFRLMRDEDPVAEMYLTEIENQISHDVTLMRLLANPELNPDAIRNHLVKFYFFGFWNRYEMQLIPCWPMGNLYIHETGEVYNCYNYFFELLENYGYPIEGSNHFNYLDNSPGQVSYFGVFRFFPHNPALETTLFIQLYSKPFYEGLGYPELLISDSELAHLNLFEDYSYAKYINGNLVKRSGNFVFSNDLPLHNLTSGTKKFVKDGGYSHLYYKSNNNVVIALSREDYSISDIFMALSIFFIMFFVAGALTILLLQWRKSGFSFKISIQKRIQVSFVLLLLLMLLIVATGTVYYTIQQFKRKHLELLEAKVRSVLHDLEYRVGFEGIETSMPEEYLNYQLQMISNVFHCDINLFGLDGKLVGTSRPEIFRLGLAGLQMNPSAYFNLTYHGEQRYLTDERIGRLEYTSLYMPITGHDDRLYGFVNLPYFVGNDELHEEVSSVIVTVVNFYLAFSFLVIGFAVFLARQITRPLLMLQDRISRIQLGRLNEKIDYKAEDEIGGLVSEYNRMVDELAVSAEKLAKTERDLAWREMAKQIAHEIKNPLTPMKLNVQYLQKAWNDKVEDFDSYLNRVANTLIEQINNLSSIASEFSKFAQMPSAKAEEVNLVEKIENCCTLFASSTLARITLENQAGKVILVKADGEQLLGVFNNLIKNAIQAINPDQEGLINIRVQQLPRIARVSVSDNGRGVPENIRHNLFEPSFTTKTGGKGLGLAIARRIVENAGGNIWFDSEEGKGATFYVDFPTLPESSST